MQRTSISTQGHLVCHSFMIHDTRKTSWFQLVLCVMKAVLNQHHLNTRSSPPPPPHTHTRPPRPLQLSFLKNLDKLIRNGQGIEMVALLRIAPLPKGPTNYFLGTTSCTWRDFIIGRRSFNYFNYVDVALRALRSVFFFCSCILPSPLLR